MEENYVVGTCQLMCPIKEAKLRQKENLLHKFEIKKGTEGNRRPEYDPEKIVKSFSRSAAGAETTTPSNLRPFPVLIKTIEYLYREIFPIHEDKPLIVYNFMFDRFRAVRQDAVIQNLPPENLIKILEPIVRFFIYFGYILIEESATDFDAHINDTHLQECMKRLLVCYDELNEPPGGSDRWEIESAYLLFNLGNIKPLTRGSKLFELHPNNDFINAFNMSLQWYLRNYKRVFDIIIKLPPLLLCVVSSSVPAIREYSLKAMCHCYSSSNSNYPVGLLRDLLLFKDDEEVVDECRHFKVKISDGGVHFLKKDFDCFVGCRRGTRLKWIEEALSGCDVMLMCLGGGAGGRK